MATIVVTTNEKEWKFTKDAFKKIKVLGEMSDELSLDNIYLNCVNHKDFNYIHTFTHDSKDQVVMSLKKVALKDLFRIGQLSDMLNIQTLLGPVAREIARQLNSMKFQEMKTLLEQII